MSDTVVLWLKVPLVPLIVSTKVPTGVRLRVVMVNVDVPAPPVTDEGLNVPVVRVGNPVTLSVTVPLNPLTLAIVTVNVVEAGLPTVWPLGLAVIVKSGFGAGFTTNVTVVEWLKLPLVPVTVSVYVPAAVDVVVFTVRVELPEPTTEVGLKLAEAPVGNPLTVKLTVPLKPPEPASLTE